MLYYKRLHLISDSAIHLMQCSASQCILSHCLAVCCSTVHCSLRLTPYTRQTILTLYLFRLITFQITSLQIFHILYYMHRSTHHAVLHTPPFGTQYLLLFFVLHIDIGLSDPLMFFFFSTSPTAILYLSQFFTLIFLFLFYLFDYMGISLVLFHSSLFILRKWKISINKILVLTSMIKLHIIIF